MAAHVRRINSQDKIATGILTAIVGLVLLILAAIVFYILVAGAGKLFDVSFLTSKPQQFKAGGGIGPELFNSFYLLFLTLVISVPTLIASLWGMNVGGIPLSDNPHGFLIMCLISLMLALIAVVMLWRRKMF